MSPYSEADPKTVLQPVVRAVQSTLHPLLQLVHPAPLYRPQQNIF